MQSAAHIDDDALSVFVDQQLDPDDSAQVVAHVETCSECQARLEGFRSVVGLLRRLPELEPPREFTLGPRVLADPPNVVRLRRWYTASRAAAGTLAAVFVFLLAGTLYMDSRAAATAPAQVARPQAVVATAPAPPTPAAAPPAAARAAARAQPAAAGAPAAAASRPAPFNPQADDQVAAATSVSPLPTQAPTPLPTAIPQPVSAPALASPPETIAPMRSAAAAVGALAFVALLVAFFVRSRLQRAFHP
ncbi:MAG: zf-HC2 domain-containing protein [Chloroflexi bacterium]|nr:zf-HC2 domain-containing protein [Chloroflexota bacterium]